jgi:hypothetical protein
LLFIHEFGQTEQAFQVAVSFFDFHAGKVNLQTALGVQPERPTSPSTGTEGMQLGRPLFVFSPLSMAQNAKKLIALLENLTIY